MALAPTSSRVGPLAGSASVSYLLVQTGAPTTYTNPIVYDDTAVTGGLYAWNGTAYVKVGGLAP